MEDVHEIARVAAGAIEAAPGAAAVSGSDGTPDPLIVGRAAQILAEDPHIYDAATHPAMQRG
jgi:hypothetical protein